MILCYFDNSRTEELILFSKISEENYRTNTYVVVVISKDRLSAKTLILISKPSLEVLLGVISFRSNRIILKEAQP